MGSIHDDESTIPLRGANNDTFGNDDEHSVDGRLRCDEKCEPETTPVNRQFAIPSSTVPALKESNRNDDAYQRCPHSDIEFIDLTYTVPVGRNG